MSAYPSTQVAVIDVANSVSAEGVSKSADWYSTWISAGDADWIGIVVSCSVAGGTSPTLDITLEYTDDSGAGTVSVHSYPAAANSQTGAALAQITATGNAGVEYWRNIVPTGGAGAAKVRFKFDLGGTSPAFTLDVCKYILVARGTVG